MFFTRWHVVSGFLIVMPYIAKLYDFTFIILCSLFLNMFTDFKIIKVNK